MYFGPFPQTARARIRRGHRVPLSISSHTEEYRIGFIRYLNRHAAHNQPLVAFDFVSQFACGKIDRKRVVTRLNEFYYRDAICMLRSLASLKRYVASSYRPLDARNSPGDVIALSPEGESRFDRLMEYHEEKGRLQTCLNLPHTAGSSRTAIGSPTP